MFRLLFPICIKAPITHISPVGHRNNTQRQANQLEREAMGAGAHQGFQEVVRGLGEGLENRETEEQQSCGDYGKRN